MKELSFSGNKRLKISAIMHIWCSLKSLETLTISQTQKDIDFKLENIGIKIVMN
ncbi:hypothetical protein [Clostridium gasigenes]|uniref:hypothetical protein n=1 Tax=Clostridium gasigenes TaxID=94869 RepID=UPI001C0B6CD8|nr:hypothetical protein [Clostridium gasigenes]MBU3104297.1 hypothetical protein [Clostridium gasigenes]